MFGQKSRFSSHSVYLTSFLVVACVFVFGAVALGCFRVEPVDVMTPSSPCPGQLIMIEHYLYTYYMDPCPGGDWLPPDTTLVDTEYRLAGPGDVQDPDDCPPPPPGGGPPGGPPPSDTGPPDDGCSF